MKLLNLKVKNLFCFCDVDIKFSELKNGLILVQGIDSNDPDKSNGVGKSSLFEVINWVLFDETVKQGLLKDKDGIIRNGSKGGWAELRFEFDKKIYEIKKVRRNGKTEISMTCNHQDLLCNNKISVVKKHIVNLLGINFDVWKNSVIMGQNEFSELLNGTNKERSDLIGKILNFSFLDRCAEYCKEKYLTVLKDKKDKIVLGISVFNNIVSENMKNFKKIEDIQTEILFRQDNYILENKILNELVRQQENSEKNSELEKLYKSRLNELENLKSEITEFKNKDSKNVASIQFEIQKQEKILQSKIDFAEIKKSNAENRKIYEQINISINNYNNEIAAEQATIQNIEVQRRKINIVLQNLEKETETTCSYCGNIITDDCKKTLQNNLKELVEKISDANKKIADLQGKIADATAELKLIAKNIVSDIDVKELTYNNAISRKKDLEKQLVEARERFDERSKGYTELQQRLAEEIVEIELDVKNHPKVDHTYKISMSKAKIEKIKEDIDDLEYRFKSIKNAIAEAQKLNDELVSVNTKYAEYNKIFEMFGRNGIRNHLIDSIIPLLENNINGYLTDMGKEYINVSLSVDNGFKIDVSINDNVREANLFSGGENKLISIILYLSLSDIILSNGYNFGWQILDESTDNLDTNNTELLINLLSNRARNQNRQIFMITHSAFARELIESNCAGKIIIHKKDGVSNI